MSKLDASEFIPKLQTGVPPAYALHVHVTSPSLKKLAGFVAPAALRSHFGTLIKTFPLAVIALVGWTVTVKVAEAPTICELLAMTVLEPSEAA